MIKDRKRAEKLQARRAEFIERVRPEMVRLSIELHDGQYAPNSAEFFLFAEEMPSRHDMNVVFGPWENVANACGLKLADAKYYYAKRVERAQNWDQLEVVTPTTCADYAQERRKALLPPPGMPVVRAQLAIWRDRAGRTYQEMRYELR